MDDSKFAYLSHNTPHLVSLIGLSYCIYKIHTIQASLQQLLPREESVDTDTDKSPPSSSEPSNTPAHHGWWPVCSKGGKDDL
jgi:hypothetical protein